jgi:putative ABC transport system permease protein
MRQLLRRLWHLTHRQRAEADLAEEMALHRELKEQELQERGTKPTEAKLAARRALGSMTLARDEARDVWIWRWLDDLAQDTRYAVRRLGLNRGFTTVAVLTVALGIGANTAIFSVVNAILLRPLPFKNSDRFIQLMQNVPATEGSSGARSEAAVLSVAELTLLQVSTRTLTDAGTYSVITKTWTRGDEPIQLVGTELSTSFFSMLDATPLLGRTFELREETNGAQFVVLLSYRAWQRYWAGSADILEQSLTLDGRPYRVVGVMPQGFQFPDSHSEFWTPFSPLTIPGFSRRFPVYGRLANGIALNVASAELSAILTKLRDPLLVQVPYLDDRRLPFEVTRLQDPAVESARPALILLVVAVGVVLLMACVNLANLLLARSISRQREVAVCRALGASRLRVIRQMLTESCLVALLGGTVGVGLAVAGIHGFRFLATTLSRIDVSASLSIPRLDEIGIDYPVLGFTLCLSVVTGLAFGLVPAIRQSRSDSNALRGRSSLLQSDPLRDSWLNSLLTVAQVAMAVALFIAGGLLIRTVVNLLRVHPGFEPRGVLTFQIHTPPGRYLGRELTTLSETILARLRAVPGVRAAGYTNHLPMTGAGFRGSLRLSSGTPAQQPTPSDTPLTDIRTVSQEFLTTLGVTTIAGRGFSTEDREGRPLVVLINQRLATSGYLGPDPVGSLIYAGGRGPAEVVGVVADVHVLGLEQEPQPQVFVNSRQQSPPPRPDGWGTYFAIRTDVASVSLVTNIRRIVQQIDATVTIDHIATMDQLLWNSIARQRLLAWLFAIFASMGVALALIGIYGLIVYSVAQRRREMGIHMALGATQADIVSLVVRRGLLLTAAGVVAGVAGAAGITRYLAAMLFGVTPADPTTFVAVSTLMGTTALVAAYLPARQATRTDPMVALRCE